MKWSGYYEKTRYDEKQNSEWGMKTNRLKATNQLTKRAFIPRRIKPNM